MSEIYRDIYATYVFQDKGHTGKIHDAESDSNKHLGMFIFDLGDSYESYLVFKLFLKAKFFSNSVPYGEPLFKIIPGKFSHPERITYNDFINESSLIDCGWEPFLVPDGKSGPMKVLEKIIYSDNISMVENLFVFKFSLKYLGFLIEPFVTDDGTGKHFEIEFGGVFDMDSFRPRIKIQRENMSLEFSDVSSHTENTRNFVPREMLRRERSKALAGVNVLSGHDGADSGILSDAGGAIRVGGHDPAVNYSMVIQHIALSETGKIVEIYGFNGYTERAYYPDDAFSLERAKIKKLNVVTWSGLLVEWPWAAMLWYGKIIYFANQEEFNECCHQFFMEHGNDACPVCGEPLGEQLKFSFIDVTRVPHQFYFCSRECLRGFNSKLMLYLKLLSKPNIDYLYKIKM